MAQKRTEIYIKLTSHSPLPTPLLPASTLSAGESKVSGGESEVSRRVGLPRSSRAPRSKPKMASLYFWWPSRDSPCRYSSPVTLLSHYLCSPATFGLYNLKALPSRGGGRGKAAGKERWQERKGGRKGKGDRRGKVTGEFSHCFSSQHG
jgi:hypothetical protein